MSILSYADRMILASESIDENTASAARSGAALVALGEAQLAVAAAQVAATHQVAANVQHMHAELAQIGNQTNRELSAVNDHLAYLRVELDEGLSAVKDSVRELQADLNEGFERVVIQLQELQRSVNQSETTKVALEHKKTAFHWLLHDEPSRALVSAVSSFSLVDGRYSAGGAAGKTADETRMDPETNVLAARLLFEGVEPHESIPATDPVKCAKDALSYGKTRKEPALLQAASLAAHLLADEARSRGAHAEGLKYDLQSFALEQRDLVDAVARVVSAQIHTAPPGTVGEAVAVMSLVSARFPLLFLAQLSCYVDRGRTDAVLADALQRLRRAAADADERLAEQAAAWQNVSEPVKHAAPPEAAPTGTIAAGEVFASAALIARHKVEVVLLQAATINAWTDAMGRATHGALSSARAASEATVRTIEGHYSGLHRKLDNLGVGVFGIPALLGGMFIFFALFGTMLLIMTSSGWSMLIPVAGWVACWIAGRALIAQTRSSFRAADTGAAAPHAAHAARLEAAAGELARAGAALPAATNPAAHVRRTAASQQALPFLAPERAPASASLAVIHGIQAPLGVEGRGRAGWRPREPERLGAALDASLDVWLLFGAPAYVEHARPVLTACAAGEDVSRQAPPIAPPAIVSVPHAKIFGGAGVVGVAVAFGAGFLILGGALVTAAVERVVALASRPSEPARAEGAALPGDRGANPAAAPPVAARPGSTTHAATTPNAALPAIPDGRSKVPTLGEWGMGVTVNSAAEPVRAPDCSVTLLREWLKAKCMGSGASISFGAGTEGLEKYEFVNADAFGDVVMRLHPGMDSTVDFGRREGGAQLRVVWPAGDKRPSWIGLSMSGAPAAPARQVAVTRLAACVSEARASSAQPTHPASHVFDGSTATAWNEASPGDGTGQWVEARFPAGTHLDHVEVGGGWSHTTGAGEDLWTLNNSFRVMRVSWDGGSREISFDRQSDRDRQKRVDIGASVTFVRFEARAVDHGRFADLCLDEATFFGTCGR